MPRALLATVVNEAPISMAGQGAAADPSCARRSVTCNEFQHSARSQSTLYNIMIQMTSSCPFAQALACEAARGCTAVQCSALVIDRALRSLSCAP